MEKSIKYIPLNYINHANSRNMCLSIDIQPNKKYYSLIFAVIFGIYIPVLVSMNVLGSTIRDYAIFKQLLFSVLPMIIISFLWWFLITIKLNYLDYYTTKKQLTKNNRQVGFTETQVSDHKRNIVIGVISGMYMYSLLLACWYFKASLILYMALSLIIPLVLIIVHLIFERTLTDKVSQKG
jgi:hypothetical protein